MAEPLYSVVQLEGVIDDDRGAVPASIAPQPSILLVQGTSLRFVLVLKTAAGLPAPSSAAVVTVSVKKRAGQFETALISRLAVAQKIPGVWWAEIVPQDTTKGTTPPGRFVMDVDYEIPSVSRTKPIRARSLIIGDAVGMPGQPVTSPTPSQIVAYGLPTPQPPGALLTAEPGGSVAWVVPSFVRNFFRASFANQFTAVVDYSSLGLLVPPTRVLAAMPVTDSLLGVECQVEQSSITNTGCVIRSNSNGWSGFVDAEVIA